MVITIPCCEMSKALPWAKHDEVHTGKSQIMYTVLQGNTIEPFTINITKVHRQNTSDVKGIEFTIADERLASASNGIVQGMSGSPDCAGWKNHWCCRMSSPPTLPTGMESLSNGCLKNPEIWLKIRINRHILSKCYALKQKERRFRRSFHF